MRPSLILALALACGCSSKNGASPSDGGSGGAGGSGGSGGSAGGGGGGGDMAGTIPTGGPSGPAVMRGGMYFGFPEQFNRYYTDPSWTPTTQLYVSANGSGDGKTHATPAAVGTGLSMVAPGTMVNFLAGTYSGCYELGNTQSGTYDQPIVLKAEVGVHINCCNTGRMSCINLEDASYVAVDGFEFQGGKYGLRSVGADYAASMHQRGTAVLNCTGYSPTNDPFFTGESDWAVWERNVGHDAGTGDGHGMYLSNGSDWNIVRFNELYNNNSSDFQINADPISTCMGVGIAYNTPDCDALAGTPGDGGRGASDFMLVDSNYFHHGLAQGPNFTSVRHSVVRNNIFALYAKHNTSFWQESTNPNLGSHDNIVEHNLFIGDNNQHVLQFIVNSGNNTVKNNLLVGASVNGGSAITANASSVLIELDSTTVGSNTFAGNYYVGGTFTMYTPASNEIARADLDPAWFTRFATATPSSDGDWLPTAGAPFLKQGGAVLPDAPYDRRGKLRAAPVDVGPFELK